MVFTPTCPKACVPSGFGAVASVAALPSFHNRHNMHARELLELGALVAVHAPTLIHNRQPIPFANLAQYWTASRCRLDRWTRTLAQYGPPTTPSELETMRNWRRIRPVLEEILTGELLTRIWAAAATAYDQAHASAELEPVAFNVFVCHQEARNRALRVMLQGRGFDAHEAVLLNRLRCRVERWCDMLLAHLANETDITPFAFEVSRARDFADDLSHDRSPTTVNLTWQLVLASLRSSFQTGLAERSPNADLNRDIGNSLLALFHEHLFDSTGLPKSLWFDRLANTASDTQMLLDELIALDAPRRETEIRWRG